MNEGITKASPLSLYRQRRKESENHIPFLRQFNFPSLPGAREEVKGTITKCKSEDILNFQSNKWDGSHHLLYRPPNKNLSHFGEVKSTLFPDKLKVTPLNNKLSRLHRSNVGSRSPSPRLGTNEWLDLVNVLDVVKEIEKGVPLADAVETKFGEKPKPPECMVDTESQADAEEMKKIEEEINEIENNVKEQALTGVGGSAITEASEMVTFSEGKELLKSQKKKSPRRRRNCLSEKDLRSMEAEWNNRFALTYRNDGININYRSYFDRMRDYNGGLPKGQDALLPTWTLGEYKYPKPANKDQENLQTVEEVFLKDMETDWNPKHALLYSRLNDRLHPNYRSYFDRKMSLENMNAVNAPKLNWRLPPEP